MSIGLQHCVFPVFCCSGESKTRLAKAEGAEPPRQMRDQRLHAAVAGSRFGSHNMSECQEHLGVGALSDVEKVHALASKW